MTNSDILTIILAAGKSKRFSEAGFPKPKTLLPMPSGKTLLEEVVHSLDPEDLLFVGEKSHTKAMFGTIRKLLFSDLNYFRHVWIHETDGPLATAWEIRSWLDHPKEILISYCDILLDPGITHDFVRSMRDMDMDAGIVGFDSPQDRFTTVKDSSLKASGVFYFKSGRDLIRRMRFRKKQETNGLPEMVYLYEKWGLFDASSVLADLGTPTDYKYWAGKRGMTTEDFGF